MNPEYSFLIAAVLIVAYLIAGLLKYLPFLTFFLSRMSDPKYDHIPTWQRTAVKLCLFIGLFIWPVSLWVLDRIGREGGS